MSFLTDAPNEQAIGAQIVLNTACDNLSHCQVAPMQATSVVVYFWGGEPMKRTAISTALTVSSFMISTVMATFTLGCGQAERYYTLTIVEGFNADGTAKYKTQPISESDEIAMRDPWTGVTKETVGSIEQGLHGLSQSYYCDSSWFWAFDGNHEVGNAICFKAYYQSGDGYFGYADLNNFCLDGGSGGCSNNWWAKIKSYWVPYDTITGQGYLQNDLGAQEWFNCTGHWTTCGSFPGYSCCHYNSGCGATHEAGTYGQQSRYIFLGWGDGPSCSDG